MTGSGPDTPDPSGEEADRLVADERAFLKETSEALLAPSMPYMHLAFDLWPDGGDPILGSIGLVSRPRKTQMIFCYRTTTDPGRARAMAFRLYEEGEDYGASGSAAYNAITQGDLEPMDLDAAGDLTAAYWSSESSARHAIEGQPFDPSRRNLFISYDVGHYEPAAERLIDQSQRGDSPFVVVGTSKSVRSDWAVTKQAIERASNVVVMCGLHDPVAENVERELYIANSLNKPHFLLGIGEPDDRGRKPQMAFHADQIYKWTWENLLTLLRINGDAPRPPSHREKWEQVKREGRITAYDAEGNVVSGPGSHGSPTP